MKNIGSGINFKISFFIACAITIICAGIAVYPYLFGKQDYYISKGDALVADRSFFGFSFLGAANYYKKAIDTGATEFAAYEKYSAVLAALENYSGAAKIYESIIEKDPKEALAHYNLARVYLSLAIKKNDEELYNKSVESLRKAMSLNPKSANFYLTLARAYEDVKRYEDARKVYREFISKKIFDRVAIYNLIGNTYFIEENYKDALVNYERAIAEDKNYAVSYINAGDTLMKIGNAEQALDRYKKALIIEPELTDAMVKIAGIYYDKMLYGETIKYCEAILQRYPEDSSANYFLGMVMNRFGRTSDAINYFEKAAAFGSDMAVEELKALGITLKRADVL